jgi:oligopeptide/dipeptide ABC transporter ATP-binding protein
LITHDLGVVAGFADRVHVMYAGRLVETGPTGVLYRLPIHPYTRGLLASVPTLTGDPSEVLFSIDGVPPDLARLPDGCAFAPRCSYVEQRCRNGVVPLETVGKVGAESERRNVACYLASQISNASGGPR